jgi:hypothetical protein
MLDILSIIPGKKRKTPSGWYSFNAPCCLHRGHNADTRGRGGIVFDDERNWIYNCFNCHFKAGFTLGKSLTKHTKLLLHWCGVDESEINKLSLESLSKGSLIELKSKQSKAIVINFPKKSLSDTCVKLDERDPEHLEHIKYLREVRGIDYKEYPFYIDEDSSRPGIIIPYYYDREMVGHTCRFIDGRKPKYLSDQTPGYIFNIDAQKKEWTTCILVEGQFDALSIDGCAYMGSTISDGQVELLNRLRRTIIVVPDQDKPGLSICDRALELGYKVSIPEWHSDVKDVNDAVKRYGKLSTLLSIFSCATSSKIKVEMAKKRFK